MDTAIPVRATIEKYGQTAVADAMGLPISTIETWRQKDRIPGRGVLHDMKVKAFRTAVRTLKPKSQRTAARRQAAEDAKKLRAAA